MFSEKVEQRVYILEKQELEAASGIIAAPVYAELFASYLYRNDLSNARFLWKRIPQNIKNGNLELEKMYKIFQCLWNNDTPGFYKEMNFEWSKSVAELMFELKEKVQLETINLIGRAYSSISENIFGEMINKLPETIDETCKNLGWEIEVGARPRLIQPVKPGPDKIFHTTPEDQLQKLTEFVSFLEN